jgi:two-component sensor histidine kinase
MIRVSARRSIRFTLTLTVSLVVAALSFAFIAILVQRQAGDLVDQADARLLMAAEFSRELLGSGYHDRILDGTSVPPEQFSLIVERNDSLCRRLRLQYLWSVLQVDGRLVFTSATHSDLNDPASSCAAFFETHRDPGAFSAALLPGLKPAFSTFKNEWGEGRMVLVPRKDALGRVYIMGASVQLDRLVAMVRRTVMTIVGIGLAILLATATIVPFLVRPFSRRIEVLSKAADRMAAGDLDLPLGPVDSTELQVLSDSLDTMRQALKDQIEILRRNLAEKEAMLRELHHRVKNNLSVISSLLNLQASVIRSPEEALEGLVKSRDRILAMSLVHEELYKSPDHARIGMGRYIERLTEKILRLHGPGNAVRIVMDVGDVELGVDSSIPCALILNELVSNAFAHAFPAGRPGKIRVFLREAGGGNLELGVSDDGVGFPEAFKGPGHGSMGLTMVRLLAEQLDGTCEFSSEGGTTCRILFPKGDRP